MVRAPVVAAASQAVLPLLNGPLIDGAVLAAFTRAVIIGVPTPDGPRVLSLLAPTAAGVPNGVRCAAVEAAIEPAVLMRDLEGDAATVGGGRVLLAGLEVRVVRSWRCRVPQLTVGHQDIAAVSEMIIGATASKGPGVPEQFVVALESALTSSLDTALDTTLDTAPAAVRGLVGRGLGLTPAGDDVIAGALCGLHATGATAGARLLAAAALDNVAERTTLLSADLLRLAAGGAACLEVLAVLRAANRPRDVLRRNESAVWVAIDRLLRVGHTSGADLATGLAVGLRAGSAVGTRERAGVG